jgi:peptidoglycan/xylan/chitin deacetylase (PgdA/CDA1 family)
VSILNVALAAVVAIILGLNFARRLVARPIALGVVGAAVAIVGLWLFPQRDDLLSALVLGALIGIGGGIAIGSARQHLRGVDFAKGHSWAVGSSLVVVTALLVGYIGAVTPDVGWFGGGVVHGPTNGNMVALTFDDGPNPRTTPAVMQILASHGLHGTFFEVGKAIVKEPAVVRALDAAGDQLGNHSYHHDSWSWLEPSYPELQKTQRAFEQAIGKCPGLYRPPHGYRTPFIAHIVDDHQMKMVLWNVSAGDWATTDAQLVARRVLDKVKPGSIILLHDGLDGNVTADRSVVARALPMILDGLAAKGLHPVRLDQLIGGHAFVPC